VLIPEEPANHVARHVRLREAALNSNPSAQVCLDVNGYVVLANERARSLFGLTGRDLGGPFQDCELHYRIPLLREAIVQAQTLRRPGQLREVSWPLESGDIRILDVQVAPLLDGGSLLGVSLAFIDVTEYRKLQDELRHTHDELETSYEELQATNEELETTNEELQSTVEELETTNEELQSTNEELQTMNDELRQRSEELNQVNGFLATILSSLRAGVTVVDGDLRVRVWNQKMEDLWGLRNDEVHQRNFLNLDIGLPVEQLKAPIRAAMSGETEFVELILDCTNRRGKPIKCRVTCTHLSDRDGGVILLVEDMAASH
jgi:two-component system CheB/CheR fusion protein